MYSRGSVFTAKKYVLGSSTKKQNGPSFSPLDQPLIKPTEESLSDFSQGRIREGLQHLSPLVLDLSDAEDASQLRPNKELVEEAVVTPEPTLTQQPEAPANTKVAEQDTGNLVASFPEDKEEKGWTCRMYNLVTAWQGSNDLNIFSL